MRGASIGRATLVVAIIALTNLSPEIVLGGEPVPAQQVAAKVDGFLESHWNAGNVQPARPADEATFLRRITLDLCGRIPTTSELERFLSDPSDDKRRKLIERLIGSPEFPLHFGNVLDQMIQERYAGNPDFVDYLRRSVRDSKPWDKVFRELMLGPWDTEPSKAANRFLDKRAKISDVLAVDTARVFFGVDISCAKCHDHPLVEDWKQEHFYGMVAFFHRTTGGKGKIGEKKEGDVKFLGDGDKEQIAKVMFLSGQVIEDPTASTAKSADEKSMFVSRREQLVNVALEDRNFFSRAMVNRMWEYFFGRGLIDPVDQMHSGNQSIVPGLLPWLADDFAESGYDLSRLISALVNTRAYQLSSRREQDTPDSESPHFAAASLRPLTSRQLAFSLIVATGAGQLTAPSEIQSRVERYSGVVGLRRIEQYLTIEQRAAEIMGRLDDRRPGFQSGVDEALFMSNNAAIQEFVSAMDDNLAGQLGQMSDTRKLVSTAVRTILNRTPSEEEMDRLTGWFASQGDDRQQTSEQLVWALVTSAEFRFNH